MTYLIDQTRAIKFGVCAPVGGFGNHIRWLLWTDSLAKYQFIEQNVYPTDRTWNNWLDFEWRHREILDQTIILRHKIVEVPDVPTVILTVDPSLALRNYLKFNPNLGMATIENFCQSIEDNNRHNLKFCRSKSVIVHSSEAFWNADLDIPVYESMVNFLKLQSNVDLVQQTHRLWWSAQQRSEKDIVNFLSDFYRS